MKVAFDCDGTLKDYKDDLRDEVVTLLFAFLHAGAEVIIWSGGGKDYANGVWCKIANHYPEEVERLRDLELNPIRMGKDKKIMPDLTFDDMQVTLGVINVCIPPKV